jgi:hypothetical protein
MAGDESKIIDLLKTEPKNSPENFTEKDKVRIQLLLKDSVKEFEKKYK